MTQPFQVLWLLGVQVAAVQTPAVHVPVVHVPLAPGSAAQLLCNWFCDVYCDLEQALLPVQLLWVGFCAGFEHVPAPVQLLWVVLPEIEHVPAPVQLLWLL